jgi:hypothetical protein
MSGVCYPDSLIGVIPNLYYYAANNPSEATIAKRRSYANTISYLTPPAENAGLYKGLKELKELIASYQVGVRVDYGHATAAGLFAGGGALPALGICALIWGMQGGRWVLRYWQAVVAVRSGQDAVLTPPPHGLY